MRSSKIPPAFTAEELADFVAEERVYGGVYDGKRYTEHLIPGGRIRGEMAHGYQYQGRWHLDGARLCTHYPSYGVECTRVAVEGKTIWFIPDGDNPYTAQLEN